MKLTGIEYMLNEVMEPHLFVIRKQKRDGPEKVTPMLTYYVLDGSIYQAPQLSSVFASRMSLVNMNPRILAITLRISDWTRRVFVWQVRALYYISKSFTAAASKLEKIGYDTESDSVKPETKAGAENIDFKEVRRVDQILTALQRKLPPAPPLPPFPEGFAATSSDMAETQDGQAQNGHTDPIIDQGAAKRIKLEK